MVSNISNLIYLCKSLSHKPTKCEDYIEQILDTINFASAGIYNNILGILFIVIAFITIVFQILIKKKITNKPINIFIIFNFFLIFFLIIFFQNKLPFTDSWYELRDLVTRPIQEYLFTKVDYFLFSFRFFHAILLNKFFLNYHLLTYVNFIIYICSFFFLILYIKKNKLTKYLLLFVLIFFNGKWINILYEPVNIVWTINFILLLIYCYLFHNRNNIKYLLWIFIVLILLIINFKASVVVISFSIFYGLFILSQGRQKLFFVVAPLIILLLVYLLTNQSSIQYDDKDSLKHYIPTFNLLLIFKNLLSMQSIVFFPFLKISIYLSVVVSFFQNLLIFKFLINKKNFFSNIKIFFLENPLLILGYAGCFLVSFTKEDILQIRYFSFSLIFQLGFLFFLIKNYNFLLNGKIYNYLRNFLILIYFTNLIFFHQGIYFALSKHAIYKKSLECLQIESFIDICKNYIYTKTFNVDQSFERDSYNSLIIFLKKNNLSIFKDLEIFYSPKKPF
jgi:hypothetical protein